MRPKSDIRHMLSSLIPDLKSTGAVCPGCYALRSRGWL